ncbi:MAG: hypothetical protein ACRDJ5_08430, partial [Actinomycetota bacterium]
TSYDLRMNLALGTKILLRAGILLSLVAYLVIVDLGVNAGRVHRGVAVDGIEIGGLTRGEATRLLKDRATQLRTGEIEFGAKGLRFGFVPKRLGWWGGVENTVDEAWDVGRAGAPLGAMATRARAWTRGVRLEWAGRPRPWKVTQAIDRVEKKVEESGYELRRYKFRSKIRRAILTWPRERLRLPIR